jgi:Tfp pilus assembly ATPase PilU
MPGLMADNDSRGQFAVIHALLESDTWRQLWSSLNLQVVTFEDLGLPANAADVAVWEACQERQIILVTGNRNAEGPDSLEATIRARNAPDSTPVITIANPRRLMRSKAYADRATERLLEYLLNLDQLRGAGRLYIP